MKTVVRYIVSLGLLFFGVVVLVYAVKSQMRLSKFSSQALEPIVPRSIRISNLTDRSAAISWYTRSRVDGYVVITNPEGQTLPAALDDRVSQVGQADFYTHHVTVIGLEPETVYSVTIISDGVKFDQDTSGQVIKFTTLPSRTSPPPPPQNIFGRVLDVAGQPTPDALVYIKTNQGPIISAITDQEGAYVLDLRAILDPATGQSINLNQEKIYMTVIQGELARSNILIDDKERGLIPPIRLGKNYDFSVNYPQEGQEIKADDVQIQGQGMPGNKVKIELR